MTNSDYKETDCQQTIVQLNQSSLDSLKCAIARLEKQFFPVLAHCNYLCLQQQMLRQLQEEGLNAIEQIRLPESAENLYEEIEAQIQDSHPQALMIFGLPDVTNLDQLLIDTNASRERFQKEFSFPLVLWVNDEVVKKFVRLAPDFFGITPSIKFQCAIEQFMVDCVQKAAEQVFNKILDVGAGILWNGDTLKFGDVVDLDKGFLRRAQLEAVKKDLQYCGISLTESLKASLEFLLGHSRDSNPEQRREHYEESLKLWRKLDNPKYQGCLLYCLGLWWNAHALKHPSERNSSLIQARDHFFQCVEIFKSKSPELEAKFINALAECHKRLREWDDLERIAQRALELHQQYSELAKQESKWDSYYRWLSREARAKGFLAEVALERQRWGDAERSAQEACEIAELIQESETLYPEGSQEKLQWQSFLEWQRSYHYGWFLLPLAQAQKQLEKRKEALITLKSARKETKPQYDPLLYIEILKELGDSYYENEKYLASFRLKQEKLSIEQQFGFQAFIGADVLQPKGKFTNPAFNPFTQSSEIRASGRETDIDKLIQRLTSNEYKLTIIYGPSGSGKSSLLQAGLIPKLKQKGEIEGHSVIPVIQRAYLDWTHELGRVWTEAVKAISDKGEPLPLDSIKTEEIIKQFQEQNQANQRIVLIFDEFDAWFSVCRTQEQRKEFYDFLQECLSIPVVQVIIAINEGSMHYLLECNRKGGSGRTDSNILNQIDDILAQKNLYHLGYFSQQECQKIIEGLTQETAFSLDPSLTQKLVNELAEESGEISPLTLQLVGSQLEKKEITTLAQYRQTYLSFHELVKEYIREVIHDCGGDNANLTKLIYLVLYLFTDEPPRNRPPRSIIGLRQDINDLRQDINDADLALDSKALKKIRLILKILVDSGLVTTSQEGTTKRYQLIQDYLVQPIRGGQVMQGMVKERYSDLPGKVRQTKGELKEIAHLKALSSLSQTFLLNNNQLEALLTTVKLGKKLTKTEIQSPEQLKKLKEDTLHGLRQLVYDMQEFNRLEGHSNDVYQVSFSPDGKTLASASWDKTIKLWSRQGELLQTFEGHEKGVNSVTFSPNGQLLASASGDYTIILWKLDGTHKKIGEHEDWVWDVKFSPDGQIIASASSDGTVRLWNLTNENEKIETLRHEGRVFRVSFSPDGEFLVSAGHDRKIKLWERDKNNCYTHKTTIPTDNDDIVYTLRFSPNGQTIAAGGWDKTIKVWSRDGTLLKILRGHEDCINSVRFSPNGQLLASASNDNTVKLWHLEYETCIKTFKGHSNWINSVSFSPYRQLLASAGDDNTIRLWKFEIPLLKSFQEGKEPGHTKKIHGVAVSLNEQFIASASWDGTIKLWNFDGEVLKSISAHDNWVWDVCVSPDGKTLASAGGDQKVKLWDVETGKELKSEIPKQRACVHSVSFSPDGKSLAFGSDEIRLWQLKDGTWQDSEIFGEQKNRNDIWQVRFSPDGRLLAVASSEPAIELWNLGGTLYKKLEDPKGHTELVNSISFSPDNKLLISAGNDAKLILWDVSQGTIKHWIKGHHARIYSVAFSPNGQIIASASADRTIKLWTLDFTLLRTLEGHTEWVNSICFTPDGNTLISGSSDKTIKLWDVKGIQSNLQEDRMEDPEVSEFDRLLQRGCQWLRDYVTTNQNISESDRSLLLGNNS